MAETEDRQSDLAVLEANDYKQKHRLKRVLDAHDSVEETANSLFEMWASSEISEQARNIGVQHAVKQFIRECQNLLPDDDDLDELDRKVPNPWAEHLGTIPMHSQPDIDIHGLGDYLATKELYHETWEQPHASRHGPNGATERSATHTVPKQVSWAAYSLLWEYLNAEYDIDIQFEELDDSLPTWGFEEIPEDADIPDTADLARERMEEEDTDETGEVAAGGD